MYRSLAAFMLMGGAALLAQVLVMRELMETLRGNELSIALSLGVWLLMAGAFSWAGTTMFKRAKNKGIAFSTGLFVFSLLVPLAVMAPRALLAVLGYAPGELVPAGGMLLLIFAELFLAAPLAGLMFQLGVGVMEQSRPNSAGLVYASEALGSFMAGLAFTFLVAPGLSPLQGGALASVLCLAGVLLISSSRVFSLAAVLCTFITALLFYAAPGIELRAYNRGVAAGRVVETVQSRYGAITVTELWGQYSFYVGGVYSFSMRDRDASEKKAHLPMIMHQNPSEALMIGGGGGEALAEALKHPVKRLDYVEQDPKLILVSRKYMPETDRAVYDDPRVHVHHMDGRHFVKNSKALYDLVMVCLPEPSTASVNRYYTVEFFAEVRRILKPGGILSISLPSSPNYIGRRQLALNGSIYHTLKAVFGTVRVTPEDTNYFLASMDKEAVHLDPGVLARRFEERGITARAVNRYTIHFFLERNRVAYVEDRLSRAAGLGINRDFRPVAYLYSLALWGEVADMPALDWLAGGMATGTKILRLAIPAAIAVLMLLVFFRGGLYGRASFAIATTGFSGMVFEVAAILAYQSYYGYVYEMLGLLMALFMLGLFLGSRAVTAPAFKRLGPYRLLAWLESGLMLLALTLMLVASWPGVGHPGAALSGVIFVAGLLTGAEYPVALDVTSGAGPGRLGVPGRLYGLDLAGSSIGALITGIVLIPLLGIAFTAVSVILLKAVSLGFLLTGNKDA